MGALRPAAFTCDAVQWKTVGTGSMTEWEYICIDLNNLPFKTQALDLLNDAGKESWELVGITNNGLGYLKRQIEKRRSKAVRMTKRADMKV
jgi:hypothetical protein